MRTKNTYVHNMYTIYTYKYYLNVFTELGYVAKRFA